MSGEQRSGHVTGKNINRFERDYFERWWETSRSYLLADPDVAPVTAAWVPPATDSHGGRKRFIARIRGRLLRSLKQIGAGDPLRELAYAFRQQMSFIALHPDVPQRLLFWLTQDRDRSTQRRVRLLIANYAGRLARIITRAKQQGLVGAEVRPRSAAYSLVGIIQALALRTPATPEQRGRFLSEADEAFTLYRAGLTARLV